MGLGCSHLHGHDFKMEITLRSDQPRSHQQIAQLDEIVHSLIQVPYAGKPMHELLPVATGEAISLYFFDILRKSILSEQVISIKLRETRKNQFKVKSAPI